MGSTGITVASALISIPLALGYLGREQYGLWVTINSMAVLLLTLGDMGVGNALVNLVAESHGRQDDAATARGVSTAFWVLAGVAATLAVVFAAVYPIVGWDALYNVPPQLASEAGLASAVLVGCFLLNLPLGVVPRTRLGLQEGFTNSIWTAVGSALGLGFLVLAIRFHANLPLLALAITAGPVTGAILNALRLFLSERKWLRPRVANVDCSLARRLLRSGALFFLVQVTASVSYSADSIIVAHVLGPAAVTEFVVPLRLFGFASSIVLLALTPLWPAYGESVARGEGAWAARTFLRSFKLSIVASALAAIALLIVGPRLLGLWVGDAVHPTLGLLLALGMWTIILAGANSVATFLNALSKLRVQFVLGIAVALTGIPAKIVLARSFGVTGVAWGLVASYVVCAVIPFVVVLRSVIRDLRAEPVPS